MKFRQKMDLFLMILILSACSSSYLKSSKEAELITNSEFEKEVEILIPEEASTPTTLPLNAIGSTTTTTLKKKEQRAVKKSPQASEAASVSPPAIVPVTRRPPELESDVGFDGRRPVQDPFRVGEKVVHQVSYMGVNAGSLELSVLPFAQVNQKKAYQFQIRIQTNRFFSSFYSVDDVVNVFMDFDQMIPRVFKMHLKESAQLKEARSYFDFEKNVAKYWEKKVKTKDGNVEEKKFEWEILPYSQDVYSTVFYMRAFNWSVGTTNQFRVANDRENLVFKGTAIRKEKIDTDAGEFQTIVIKPEVTLKGKFTPTGDNFIWITDDDRKLIVRIESKIKIGTLVSQASEVKK